MEELRLYAPQNEKDLREQYPDLWQIDEFKSLEVKEVLLTWYYANPTSPLTTNSHTEKVEGAFLSVYKSHDKIPADKISAWLDGNFSDSVRLAMDRWSTMKVGVRARSKNMVDKMLSNLEKMTDVSESDFQKYDEEGQAVKGVDWSARTQYANFCRITSELLPQLINQSEQGFGITKVKGEKAKGSKAIDKFHKEQKSN